MGRSLSAIYTRKYFDKNNMKERKEREWVLSKSEKLMMVYFLSVIRLSSLIIENSEHDISQSELLENLFEEISEFLITSSDEVRQTIYSQAFNFHQYLD